MGVTLCANKQKDMGMVLRPSKVDRVMSTAFNSKSQYDPILS